MVAVAQSVRALDCGSRGCGFDSRQPNLRSVAQLVEHRSPKPGVAGSIPAGPVSIACSSEVASGFPDAPAEPLAQVAARLAGSRSLGLLEPAEGFAGGAPRAGARAPAACITARDTAGKKVPDCRCGPCITAGNGAPSAPRARWAGYPALSVKAGRL